MKRRHGILWTTRLVIGLALGFGLRVLWEREPGVRFATGFALRSVGPPGSSEARPSHLQGGVPLRFSLDEITAAPDPAAALLKWREAFVAASPEARQHCLAVPVEASVTALRRCLTGLVREPDFREEVNQLMAALAEFTPEAPDPDLVRRSLTELARIDAGLALDGAEASGDDEVKQAVWAIIAEDDPQRVLDLIASGQAPAERLGDTLASLAARSPEAADAALAKLPEETQTRAVEPMARAMAATDPIKAIRESLDAHGKPDPDWVGLIARHVPPTKAVDFLLAIEKHHPDLLRPCDRALADLAGVLALRDPEFVLGWMDRCAARGVSMPSLGEENLLALAIRGNPRAATEALVASSEARLGDGAFTQLADVWMRTNPIEALDWMGRQDDSTRLLATAVGAKHLMPRDAAAVVDWFSQQGRLDELGLNAAALAGKWAADDPVAAATWAQTLPDPAQREWALSEALRHGMTFDPVAAEARLHEHVADDPRAVLSVLSRRGVRDQAAEPVLNRVTLDNLPAFVTLAETSTEAAAILQSSLVETALCRDTRDETIAALANHSEAEWARPVLAAIAKREAKDLGFVRQVTSMMSDQAEAARLMEGAVRRAFAR